MPAGRVGKGLWRNKDINFVDFDLLAYSFSLIRHGGTYYTCILHHKCLQLRSVFHIDRLRSSVFLVTTGSIHKLGGDVDQASMRVSCFSVSKGKPRSSSLTCFTQARNISLRWKLPMKGGGEDMVSSHFWQYFLCFNGPKPEIHRRVRFNGISRRVRQKRLFKIDHHIALGSLMFGFLQSRHA